MPRVSAGAKKLIKQAQDGIKLVKMEDVSTLDLMFPQEIILAPGLKWRLDGWANQWYPQARTGGGWRRTGITMEPLTHCGVYSAKAVGIMIEALTEIQAILKAKGL